MTGQLGAAQPLLSGTRVRVLRAVHPELVGATGVLGLRLRSNPVRPPARLLVRLSAPPEAVAAFPRGVFLPVADLAAAAQDESSAAARADADVDDDENEGEADEDDDENEGEGAAAAAAAARDSLEATRLAMATALGMTSTREWCSHGVLIPTAELGSSQQALVAALGGAAPGGDGAAILRAARTFLAQRPGVASEALRRICLAMALDTYNHDNGPPFSAAVRGEIAQGMAAAALAVGEAVAHGGAAPADADTVAAESLSSPLRVRRTLTAVAVCRCLHVCAVQGCGAKRARGAEAAADAAEARRAPPLQLCSQCRAAYYCCGAHQREHWPSHKRECRELAAARSPGAAERA